MKRLLFLLFILFPCVSQGQESIVCLHGFLRSYKCMIPIANVVRNEGLNVYLWDYPSRKKTIEQHAESLVEVLNALALLHPNEPIHFVTHSLGGLIVRAAVNHPLCPREAQVGKAILLAPPNKGSILARHFQNCPMMQWIFGKKAGRQLLTYTETEINKLGEFPQTMDVMIIAGEKGSEIFGTWINGPNDGKVSIEETRLNSPHTHHTLYVSHSWIMTSRESIGLTRSFLLKAPTPGTVNIPQSD